MNRAKLTLTAAVITLFSALPAQAAGSFLTGAKYLLLPETERTVLVMGLWEGWSRVLNSFEKVWSNEDRAFANRVTTCVGELSSSHLRGLLGGDDTANPGAAEYSLASSFEVAPDDGCPK